MSATTTPKKRGRPSTGNAKSSTERSRLLRERSEQIFNVAFHPGRPLEPFADSALLLAFEQSYRKRYDAYVEAIGRELFTRVGISVDTTKKDSVEATESSDSARHLLDAIEAENEGLRAEIAALRSELAEAKAKNTVAATETNSVHATDKPTLTLDPCPPPRTDAELIAILKADGWTQARIAHEIDRDQGRVSRALNRGAKLDDEAHDRLVGLVAEVERSSS